MASPGSGPPAANGAPYNRDGRVVSDRVSGPGRRASAGPPDVSRLATRGGVPLAPVRWWRRKDLRFRLTATATLVFGAALGASALLLVLVLAEALVDDIDSAVAQRARTVVADAEAGRLTNPLISQDGTMVQVVEPDQRINFVTASTDRLVPLLDATARERAMRIGEPVHIDGRPYGIAAPLRAVVLRAEGGRTVIAAKSSAEVQGSITTTANVMLIGTPLLLGMFAAASHLIIGRALRPIAALRRGADEITGTARSRRLPVPEARDEVHSLATTLNDMLARLEAAELRQRALVSDAAHELRSPLASIRLQLEVALGHPEGADWQETAEGVLEDTLRLSRLAEDLLSLARLSERGGAPSRRDPVDLSDLLCRTAARYGEARVAVTVHSTAPGLTTTGDALDLGRVLTNLVDNAVRHAATGVELHARADGSDIVVTVTDDGPGVPEADRERVFDRFTRLDSARSRDSGGAGLGLAIVRETVRAHGGSAHLEDARPGLRAVVRLPMLV
ncbi:sensor histidine kinase [Sinosporangium siamense]|uniref:histidine kinase n=1 Tax=Sinosporangium siamense TaxID=1367973 RepID=A0A919V679_9ACTN|nr:ATP-binding protein [Sinosporangium siamense]GII93780.1 hypothetical protein Ssi02_40110 [Sinosporangium siamense]